jgi:hypothetical protein
MAARLAIAAACAALLVLAAHASSEPAWVRDGTSLKLREGAGKGRAVLGAVGPGERVEVIGTLSGWSQVRRGDGTQGWIADAFLVREAPPSARVAELETEVARLRDALAAAEQESATHRAERAIAAPPPPPPVRPTAAAPRTDPRWLDYLVGALILSTGMALGAMLRGLSARRRSTRLRL